MASVVSRAVTIGSRVPTAGHVPAATTWLVARRLRSSEAGAETIAAHDVPSAKDTYVVDSPSHEEALFHDFKYHLVPSPSPKLLDSRFALTAEEQRPLVLLFGWAGATEKNLAKYSSIYHRAGCSTLAYILPTRFIFRSTADVPFLTKRLLKIVEMEGLLQRPIIFHNMSDTGLMCYQGVKKIAAERGLSLDIRGSVMDSCPGPRPKVTLPRVMALTLVNWFCSMRDGVSPGEAIYDSYRLLVDRAWPNYWRQRKGLLLELSEIDGVWSGDFLRHERPAQPWPELFMYSKADFYLPHAYLEEHVLKPRQQQTSPARDVRTIRWDNSSHVAHLRKHKKEYTNAVLDFLMEAYFQKIRK